jgi:hypothetical protein
VCLGGVGEHVDRQPGVTHGDQNEGGPDGPPETPGDVIKFAGTDHLVHGRGRERRADGDEWVRECLDANVGGEVGHAPAATERRDHGRGQDVHTGGISGRETDIGCDIRFGLSRLPHHGPDHSGRSIKRISSERAES